MKNLDLIQRWLGDSHLAGLIVPSTDEFLSEFPPAANRRLLWATGFRGSVGLAVILRKAAVLFLDGRYLRQATEDVGEAEIEILPTSLAARRGWLTRLLSPNSRLGLDPRLHSPTEVTQWQGLAAEFGFGLEMLSENPIDQLWSEARPAAHRPQIIDYSVRYAGETFQAKCAAVVDHLQATGLHALFVPDPEDVSWLLNVRAADVALKTEVGDWHVVPSCTSSALVRQDGRVFWFVDADRIAVDVVARRAEDITILPPESIAATIRDVARHGSIGTDLRRTSAAIAAILEEVGIWRDDGIVARRRWRKHPAELQAARRAHIIDATAVVRFMAWLTRVVPQRAVSEFEAAQKLDDLRGEHPDYKGASAPIMSASGPSGAQPHYIPRASVSRKLNDHPLFWIDSGGQYPGGTTDNTITLAVGTPEAKHVLAHTLVLKGFIALATTRFPAGIPAFRLDAITRQALWREGMDFPHNTGHGVGNCLNVHEGPYIGRDPGPLTMVPIEEGMIITNEPGYYAEADFGLRIESHLAVVESHLPNFLEFETISRLPIDPGLVDFDRLSLSERQWLIDYHRTVLRDLEPMLDALSLEWLRQLVGVFIQAGGFPDSHGASAKSSAVPPTVGA
ncbi:aminopeptidase P family protein [Steroidobacter cummioxidans]|uniref:aminopeptidase P family protein n=1 Tax=Steroidobacter cummioxidans TaxID=1803913 RepID=UPI000E31D91C|nr:aminopeptidase P family protein [Steroidobacter cummioxidans]